MKSMLTEQPQHEVEAQSKELSDPVETSGSSSKVEDPEDQPKPSID